MTLRSFIDVPALLALCLVSCGGVGKVPSTAPPSDDTRAESVASRSPLQPGGTAGTVPPAAPSRPDASSVREGGDWHVYHAEQYSLAFRYPPTYVPREDTPHPGQLLRISLLPPHAVGSPLEDLIPPAFAVDVYDNPVRRSIEQWLKERGIAQDKSRYSIEEVTIGGIPGLRVTSQLMLAPNIFYYVAREGYVYRFTPLGLHGEQILESVRFEP
jgi:hypothetical protein